LLDSGKKSENELLDCREAGAYLGRDGCGGYGRKGEEQRVNIGRYYRVSTVFPALQVWYLQGDTPKVRCTAALSLQKASEK